MRTKRQVRKEVKEQAEEIMYFEASMHNIDQAIKVLAERLESLYYAGFEDATDKLTKKRNQVNA
jgi:RNA processing factor Prp31